MIDLTMPTGAVSESSLEPLTDALMRALLRAEGVPEETASRKSMSWVFVHEVPAARMFAGGRAVSGRRPVFRVDVGIPAGVLETSDRAAFVAEATTLVLSAAELDSADAVARAHVWVLFRDVAEGSWGAAGRIFGLADIGHAVGASADRFEQAGITG